MWYTRDTMTRGSQARASALIPRCPSEFLHLGRRLSAAVLLCGVVVAITPDVSVAAEQRSCLAVSAYMRGLVRARDLGKTRSEADAYALDLVTGEERAALRLMGSFRRRAQEMVYTNPALTTADVEMAALIQCRGK